MGAIEAAITQRGPIRWGARVAKRRAKILAVGDEKGIDNDADRYSAVPGAAILR
jgi:hypothetical protein